MRHDVGLRRHRDDRRTGVERVGGFVGQRALAAGDDLAAVVGGFGQRGLHPVEGRAVDQRADERAAVERVADRQRA